VFLLVFGCTFIPLIAEKIKHYFDNITVERLYILCEIAEEYASIARRWLQYGMMGVLGLYVLLWLDGIPFYRIAVGVGVHLLYIPHFQNFPLVEPISFTAIVSLIGAIVNHCMWFQYLLLQYPPLPPLSHFGFLFVFVWMVPTGFFVSLTTPDDCLPTMMASAGNMGDPMRNGAFGGKQSKNIFKRLVDFCVERIFVMPGRNKRRN
jgi:hypothetical protein